MADIDKKYMYIVKVLDDEGNCDIRKVERNNVEVDKQYETTPWSCSCEGFRNRQQCKHVGMVTGMLELDSTGKLTTEEDVDSVVKFMQDHVRKLFKKQKVTARHIPEADGMSERVNVLCESDEKKTMWTKITVPIADSKFADVLVRLIFTDAFDEDKDLFEREI